MNGELYSVPSSRVYRYGMVIGLNPNPTRKPNSTTGTTTELMR
jgi:hypothetical protein